MSANRKVYSLFSIHQKLLNQILPIGMQMRFCPASAFKIPNTVITNKTREASDEKFAFHWDGVKASLEDWNRDYKLTKIFQYPVVWFYQELAKRISEEQLMADL